MQTAVRLLGGTNASRVEEEMERVLELEKQLASVREEGWEECKRRVDWGRQREK